MHGARKRAQPVETQRSPGALFAATFDPFGRTVYGRVLGMLISVPDPVGMFSKIFEVFTHAIRFGFGLARGDDFPRDPDVSLRHPRERVQTGITSAQLYGLLQMV